MKVSLKDLRKLIREVIEEDLKNVGSTHPDTVAGTSALRMMHNAPGVLASLQKIKSPNELAQVIEALLDAVPVVKRDEVLRALEMVLRHERSTRMR